MIRAELRELAELHIPADALPWFKERFGNVWARPMRQLALPFLLMLLGCGETHTGNVESFSYWPGYYTHTFIHVGKTLVPQMHWHPSTCYVRMTDGWECSAVGECGGIEHGRRVTMTCSAP